jgi:hypothetical protein
MSITNERPWIQAQLYGSHDGQIVTPVVEFRHVGKKNVQVRFRWHDASQRTQDLTWTEIQGERWAIARQLQKEERILLNDHRF